MDMNCIQIIGRLGANPELRYTASGVGVCRFRVATNRVFYQNEQKREITTWFSVSVWGKAGENCGKYLEKGQEVAVVGSMENRRWQPDRENEPDVWRDSWEIHADRVSFGSKPGGARGNYQEPQEGPDEEAWGPTASPAGEDGSEDIPF